MYLLNFISVVVVPFGLDTNIKKMRGSPKIVDSCAILGVFNIKNWRGSPTIVDSCAILGTVFSILKK